MPQRPPERRNTAAILVAYAVAAIGLTIALLSMQGGGGPVLRAAGFGLSFMGFLAVMILQRFGRRR